MSVVVILLKMFVQVILVQRKQYGVYVIAWG